MGEPVASEDGGANSSPERNKQQQEQEQQQQAVASAPSAIPPPMPFEPVPMSATRVVLHQLVTPTDVDDLGICSGEKKEVFEAKKKRTTKEERKNPNSYLTYKKNTTKGGAVLSWIDVAAGLAAKTLARGPVVTASVDAVAFLRPARRGSVAVVAAMVNRVFRSSAEIGVRVEEEVLATGERRHCCSAYLTFVSVGRAGVSPVAVMPPVAPADGAQAEVFAAAERRRAERLQARQRARECPEELPPRLQPVTHRGGMPTLAPPLLVVKKKESAAAALSSSLYSSSSLPSSINNFPQRIPPAATLSHMTQLILPQHANSLGITFGGVVLNWVEQCAHIAGARAGRCLGSSGARNKSGSGGSGGGEKGDGGGEQLSFTTTRVLTAGMDSVAFGAPTRVGDVLYVSAQVTAVWGKIVFCYVFRVFFKF